MNTKVRNSVVVAVVTALLLATGYSAFAATKGDPSPGFKHGSVDVLASAATVIPGMGQANAVLVQNLGPNPIYCGGSTVTTSTGISVPASGGTLSLDIVQFTEASGTTIKPELYCIAATADQAGTADTRYMRVK